MTAKLSEKALRPLCAPNGPPRDQAPPPWWTGAYNETILAACERALAKAEKIVTERRDGVALPSMSHPHDRTTRPRRPYFKGATEVVEIEPLEKDA